MVEARDLTEYKVGLIEENIQRHGLSNMKAVRLDATVLDEASVEKADVLIAALPCSGLGILNKKYKNILKTRIMKKLIYAPVPEQQVIYIDKEIAVINNDKVIYLKANDISDMLYLCMILDEWKLADI